MEQINEAYIRNINDVECEIVVKTSERVISEITEIENGTKRLSEIVKEMKL